MDRVASISDWGHVAVSANGLIVTLILAYHLVVVGRRVFAHVYDDPRLQASDRVRWHLMLMMLFGWLGIAIDTGWWSYARLAGANDGDPEHTWMFVHWTPVVGLGLSVLSGVGHVRTLWPWANRRIATAAWVIALAAGIGGWLAW